MRDRSIGVEISALGNDCGYLAHFLFSTCQSTKGNDIIGNTFIGEAFA